LKNRDKCDDKQRKITFAFSPLAEVQVTAPTNATNEAIHEAVISVAKWIWDPLSRSQPNKEFVQPKDYVSGAEAVLSW